MDELNKQKLEVWRRLKREFTAKFGDMNSSKAQMELYQYLVEIVIQDEIEALENNGTFKESYEADIRFVEAGLWQYQKSLKNGSRCKHGVLSGTGCFVCPKDAK